MKIIILCRFCFLTEIAGWVVNGTIPSPPSSTPTSTGNLQPDASTRMDAATYNAIIDTYEQQNVNLTTLIDPLPSSWSRTPLTTTTTTTTTTTLLYCPVAQYNNGGTCQNCASNTYQASSSFTGTQCSTVIHFFIASMNSSVILI